MTAIFFNDVYRHLHILNRMMTYRHRRLHFRHCHVGVIIIFNITAGRYGTLLTATRYVRMMTNAVIRLSFLTKSRVTLPLAENVQKRYMIN